MRIGFRRMGEDMNRLFCTVAERIGLIFGGLLLGGLILEIALQLLSLSVGERLVRTDQGDRQDVILCLGDSNTYGVCCREEEAYPWQLQVVLDSRAPDRYRVLNLGLPGMNSSQVRSRLPKFIARFHPSVVIVGGIGVNNIWNVSDVDGKMTSWVMKGVRSLRVHKMICLLLVRFQNDGTGDGIAGRPLLKRHVVDSEHGTVEHRDLGSGRTVIKHEREDQHAHCMPVESDPMIVLERDLEAIAQITEGEGARLLLLTYAACPLPGRPGLYPRVSEVSDRILRFGSEHGITVVDLRPLFGQLLAEGKPRKTCFLTEQESHPNAIGYKHIATAVADRLEPFH